MFEFLWKYAIATVNSSEEKERIANVLAENHIKFCVRKDNINSRNSFDELYLGTITAVGSPNPKYTYTFFVHKKDGELASRLIR